MIENHEPIWFTDGPRNTEQNNSFKPYTLLVATPVHSDVSMHYAQSLLHLQKWCFHNNVRIGFQLMKSSLITQGRNMCVAEFLKKGFTHLLFIDSDIAFNEGAAGRLIEANKDVISIPYPLKDMNWDKGFKMIEEGKIKSALDLKNKAFYRYPFKVPDPENIKIQNKVIEVTHSPTGFMMIKREVFEKMIIAYPNLRIDQDQLVNGKIEKLGHMWNFFDTLFDPEKRTYLGEDFAFCKRWRDIGGTCHAWIGDYITHVGEHQYTSRFADELILTDK
jgi:hypothetical protein